MLVFMDVPLGRVSDDGKLISSWDRGLAAVNGDSNLLLDDNNLLDSSVIHGGVRCRDSVGVGSSDISVLLVAIGEIGGSGGEESRLSRVAWGRADGGPIGG